MLLSDLIYITDSQEVMFVRARERYWYSFIQKGRKPEFTGPFSHYREARIAAWSIMALDCPFIDSLKQEQGYAWDGWVAHNSEIFKAELEGYTA